MPPTLRPVLHPLSFRRSFHSQSASRASILFALGALSNSRETQHFNKLSRLERVEHSPPLKLIQSSEVDPFPLPELPKASHVLTRSPTHHGSSSKIWHARAVQVGRAVLADHARRTSRLNRALERSSRRDARRDQVMRQEKAAWAEERRKMRNEMRVAGVWILGSVATATALATWRFWPQGEVVSDSGAMGRRLAERARGAIPLPAVSGAAVGANAVPVVTEESVVSAAAMTGPTSMTPLLGASTGSWWKGLFWKQP